jgi:3-hydroxyacyl-[acyl-carrier-protein] dehydratase
MRFVLIDRILEIEAGSRIVAQKNLSLAEEYLADHFPGFPVMPGVLMLEAMTQASAWLVRASEDFQNSMVVLKEARNVKYGNFVEPGQTLTITARIVEQVDHQTRLKANGVVGDQATVAAVLTLSRYNLADHDPHRADADKVIVQNLRQQFAQLSARLPLAG